MKIALFGVGYVGSVSGACFAELGNQVTCVDVDEKKIAMLKKGDIPIYEPGLKEMVRRNTKAGRLAFTTNAEEAIKNSEIIFIAVGTPSKENGSVELRYVKEVAETIGKSINDYKVIVNKSTVPVGTGDVVGDIIKKHHKGEFDVVSNPEFLREGVAINDFMHPDRVVIGGATEKAGKIISKLYEPLKCPILLTDIKSAEFIKYASNAFLATQISFINEFANLCEKLGADILKVSEGMKLDKRIGKHAFLNAGIGYGGSCFPKDVQGIIDIANTQGIKLSIIEAAHEANMKQKERLFEKLSARIEIKGKTIAVLGLSFKPNTDDMREAPSMIIIEKVQQAGGNVKAYDPVATENAKTLLNNVQYCENLYDALEGADALLICTEWNDFRNLDFSRIKKAMKNPLILDGRNVLDCEKAREEGIECEGIGR